MPSEACTALLLQKTTSAKPATSQGAEEAVVEGDLNHNPKALVDVAGSVDGNAIGVKVVTSKKKDRKRHRDGSSSRSHHKKSKDIVVVGPESAKTTVGDSSKIDAGATDVANPGSAGVRVCKSYAEKVIRLSLPFLFDLVSYLLDLLYLLFVYVLLSVGLRVGEASSYG